MIPTKPRKEGVRLDDHLLGLAMLALTPTSRHKYFPPNIDQSGMIRASRIPLGNASKTWRLPGEVDLLGQTHSSRTKAAITMIGTAAFTSYVENITM